MIKVLYILIFAAANFVIYLKLNKPESINKRQMMLILAFFCFFTVLHFDLFQLSYLIPFNHFAILLISLLYPIITSVWYNFYVVKRIDRLQIKNERFLKIAKKIFSFVFLKLVYFMAFFVQYGIILN